MQELIPFQEQFFEALTRQDVQGGLTVVQAAVDAGFPAKAVLLHVTIPALDRIGLMQANNEIALSQVFVVARIVDMAIERLNRLMSFRVITTLDERPSLGTVILGSAPGDYHSLGRKIVGTFLKLGGFKAIDLGINVPAARFVDTAVREEAKVICVSALLLHTAEEIKEIRALLRERSLEAQIKLVVGGAVFNADPELYRAVGADATAVNAHSAVTVLKQLVGGMP
ncbi:MAG: cobalamin B12-binding domain-containing protein [Chloroflexi bacterium]|nr:cobalamin B12-binding domain-containing protein [Chloroflexota bacterium]